MKGGCFWLLKANVRDLIACFLLMPLDILDTNTISAIVDEHKLAEVDRALRDVKADLAATRRRLGKTVAARPDWLSPQELANMKVGSEILVKTGKKAVCVNKSELL